MEVVAVRIGNSLSRAELYGESAQIMVQLNLEKMAGQSKASRKKNSEFSRKTDYFPVKHAYAFSFASLSFCNRNSRQQIIGTLPSRVCPNPVTSCIRKFTLSKIY
jgi:hypothetical protein